MPSSPLPAFLILLGIAAGFCSLVIWWEKRVIRREIRNKGGEVIAISAALGFLTRTFNYKVTFTDAEGRDHRGMCRVSYILGVIWEEDDSFWKRILP